MPTDKYTHGEFSKFDLEIRKICRYIRTETKKNCKNEEEIEKYVYNYRLFSY